MNLSTRLQNAESYRRWLERFYGFYAPLESTLARAAQDFQIALDLGERCKAAALKRDLIFSGLSAGEIERLPRCRQLPSLSDAAQTFGILYVVEGATLGGQIISRQIKDKLGFDAAGGAEFFNGYGARTGAMWSQYKAAAETFAVAASVAERAEIIASAQATFTAFDLWLFDDDTKSAERTLGAGQN